MYVVISPALFMGYVNLPSRQDHNQKSFHNILGQYEIKF